jgi:S1-C subfamily serine protease
MRHPLAGLLPRLLLLLSLLSPVPAAAQGAAVQEVLLRAKPAVALVIAEVASTVTVNCGAGDRTVTPPAFRETGTGWFVSPSGWMITNAHVVSAAHQPSRSIADRQREEGVRQACGAPAARALATARVRLEPSLSVILGNGLRLPATVAKYSPPVAGEAMSGQDLALLRLETADMPTLPLGDSGAAQLGDKLYILGFPGVVLSHELLSASAKAEASVTNGAISGFKQDIRNQPVIQTDAPAAWGNSGGPAVNARGEVIGVLTFVSLSAGAEGAIVQGFNFIIPTAAVREFLKDTGAPLGEASRFNAAWHAGLREFFAGRYGRATTHFAEADRLLPDLPDVKRLADEAKNPPPRPFPWATVAGAVVVVSLGGYAALLGLRWRRNRFRIRPSEVMRLLDTPEPPVIVDARAASAYAKSPVRIASALHVPAEELTAGTARLAVPPERTIVAYCT